MRLGWRIAQLGEICTFNYGKALPESARKGGSTPVFGSNGVVGHHDVPITSGRTIVIGRKGSFGEVNYSEVPSWPIDTAYFVDEASTKQDIRWLFHRLGALGLNQMNKAAAVPGLNREDAYRKEVLLPPLDEQRRIAAILDKAEVLRAKRREALGQLDRLAQSIFVEMFGDPATNPKGWERRRLDELVVEGDSINYGVVQPGDDVENGVPLIRVGDLVAGEVQHGALKRIAPEVERAYQRSRLKGDEILVSCVGSVGVVALASQRESGFNIARAVARIRVGKKADRDFVAVQLATDAVQRYFTQELRTVSQPTLNIKQIAETQMICPPLDQQHKFATRLRAVRLVRTRLQESASQANAFFESLQRQAFQGAL